MARDLYETTVALPDATGVMKALSGVKVSVVPRGAQDLTASLVNVYASDTGVTRGPDPKSGATGTNPMVTTASGAIRFWADAPYEYDLVFEDTQAPVRIADRVGWNAIPAKAGSIPTIALAEDGGITQRMLSAAVVRQQVPIGAVIEWWRPPTGGIAVPVPDGFEVADGHAVSSHDFPGISGGISMPNLQNVFILGASVNKSDGAGADQGNAVTQGPGIRATGGSNAAKNLAHGHGVPLPQHYHNAGALTTGGHSHAVATTAYESGSTVGPFVIGGGTLASNIHHTHDTYGGTDGAGNLGVGGNTDWVNNGDGLRLATATNSTTWNADPGVDFRPQFYGLLRIVKVRRA